VRLAVVGAGAAGTAAAWAAARAGAEVQLLFDRAGATELFSGALGWRHSPAELIVPPSAELQDFVAELQLWSLRAGGAVIATSLGVLRQTAGVQIPLLDLAPLAGRRVAVAEVERDGWDGAGLARALAGSAWAQRTRTRFVSIPIDLLEASHERRIGAYDFALLHDSPERIARLAQRLRRASSGLDGWLLGPWLGVRAESARELGSAVGIPVGETTSAPGGPAGARFVIARQRLLSSAGVRVEQVRVVALRPKWSGWSIECTAEEAGADAPVFRTILAEAVVLAAGGLVSGAIKLSDRRQTAEPCSGFELAFEAPVCLELDGAVLGSVSSPYGLDLQSWGSSALERVGLSCAGPRVRAASGLYVAGSMVAGSPRTVLEAVRSGIAAAAAALG
jgi:anaerobic glycerol-3-phosphate dehydrogenase